MCGIAGIFAFDGANVSCNAINLMTVAMKHRGPDDEGFVFFSQNQPYIHQFGGAATPSEVYQTSLPYTPHHLTPVNTPGDAFLVLGHRRLAILDLTAVGHQPMCTADKRYWIVYNGEIYNFLELRTELEQIGKQFVSNTDTEVVLTAYRQWGSEALKRFNGMFAFAIWDDRKKTLFCARDRIGIKPFYYTIQDGQFIFASDIKTLIASGLYRPEVNLEGLYHALSFGVTPRPLTAFKNVWALEQGCWLDIDISGNIHKEQYWQIPIGSQELTMPENEAIELLRDSLKQAVARRLAADVPVGTFMSGGIDSTTVSALAARHHSGIKAFTLAFEGESEEFNELPQAQATAKMYPMDHIVRVVQPDLVLSHLQEMIYCYEEPAHSLAPNYVISQLVAENNVTVVLNGLGGDELFAGYHYYRWIKWWKLLQVIAPLIKLTRGFGFRWQRLYEMAGVSSADRLHSTMIAKQTEYGKQALFKDNQVSNFNSVERLHQLYTCGDIEFTDEIEALSYMDVMNYIGNHHTYRVDQFTMRFSLEGRLPFLDHQLVEVAYRIPSHYKVRGNIQKYVLRKAAEGLIHPSCLTMKKKGFRLPVRRWMQGPLKNTVLKNLGQLKERDIFEADEIDRYWREFEAGRRSHTQVWHLNAVEMWMSTFIDNGGQAIWG